MVGLWRSLLPRGAAIVAAAILSAIALAAQAAPKVADGDVTLVVETEAGSVTPYVGEMILVTITGYYDATIALEKFADIDLPNFTWIQLGRDIWSKERVNGREFKTFERKLAVYPQRSGTLRIGPFEHDLTLMEGKAERFPYHVASNTVSIDVAPKPQTNGGWWLPARDVVLSDTWDMNPSRMANGATATRTIRIVATGQIAENLPKPPLMTAGWLISFIAPEERSTEITRDGPIGTVQWTWRLRPSNAEPGKIKAFRIPWFDTLTRQMREVVIPSQRVAFAAIAGARETPPAGYGLLPFVPLGLGLALPLAVILRGRRMVSPKRLLARFKNGAVSRDDIGLWWALWRDDPASYRRFAGRLSRRFAGSPDRPTADLDRSLYGRNGSAETIDLRRVHRDVVRRGGYRGSQREPSARPDRATGR